MIESRTVQEEALKALLSGNSCPPSVLVHGASNTGKTLTITSVISDVPGKHTWISCDQCPTTRVLLQRALKHIFMITGTGTADDASCENVDIFMALLSNKFRAAGYGDRHVLVLDRIDQLPDTRSLGELLHGLTRLTELTPTLSNFVVIFVYSKAEFRTFVSNPGIPRVWFPRYTLNESLKLLTSDPQLLIEESSTFRAEFLELLVNALTPIVGSDLLALKRAALRIYPQFVDGRSTGDSVAKLYVRKSFLFKSEFVIDKLEVSRTPGSVKSDDDLTSIDKETATPNSADTIAGYLLCAAYLASYNPPRYDMRSFSLAKSMRNKRRETRPKKSATIPARSLAPPAFEMERFLAIFHSILPNAFEYQNNIEVGKQFATLGSQNLIAKSQNDILDSRTKWKINVSWSYVQLVAEKIGFAIDDYLVTDA